MLLALLLPDPCDPYCPADFKVTASELLRAVGGDRGAGDAQLRFGLLKFVADFANWDLAADRTYLEVGRGLVKAAHGDDSPLVVDPFAGGGSISLEALRIGCDTFASDLNPVACHILKVMLEDIPRYGPESADELRAVGQEIKHESELALAGLYPKDLDGATPIAYLWARTVHCEAPNCGAEIPLVHSFWLSKKTSRRRALRHRIERASGESPRIEFEVFEPSDERDVLSGTVSRAKATCLCCGAVLPPERVRIQLGAQLGGADAVFDSKGQRTGGARLLAIVTVRAGETGRHYRLPAARDYEVVQAAQTRLALTLDSWDHHGRKGRCPVPNEPISLNEIRRISLPIYGMKTWGDVFTSRQKVALATFVGNMGDEYSSALACALSRVVMSGMSCTRWNAVAEKMQHTFGRQALPLVWDFAEVVPIADAPGNWESGYELVAQVIEASRSCGPGQVQLADAAEHPLPDETADVWFTDPPYYDAVPYAHLADFFLVWLNRALPSDPLLLDPFDKENPLSPKAREIVVDRPHRLSSSVKDAKFYEMGMASAFAEGRRVLRADGIGSVVFAHKTTEGWEALLSGMIRGGWTITASWPVATEMRSRLNARDTASLATSVHLVCRPRPDDARVGDWADVLRELPKRAGDWMERLQGEGVRGADLVFACIGPALEIYSRYSRVETAEGRDVPLSEYLEKVWEVVGRSALTQILGTAETQASSGTAGAVEEDARLTALFLWTLQSTDGEIEAASSVGGEEAESIEADDEEETSTRPKAKGFTLVFDVVRRFAQPLGIDLPAWEGRVIETKKGVVRLLPIAERARQLFGLDGAQAVASRLEEGERTGSQPQLELFPGEPAASPKTRGRSRSSGARVSDEDLATEREATTLDRVHAAMLFQAGGRTNALRALLAAEHERGQDFLRLANALSALYPRGSEEKRLLDAMLLAVPQ